MVTNTLAFFAMKNQHDIFMAMSEWVKSIRTIAQIICPGGFASQGVVTSSEMLLFMLNLYFYFLQNQPVLMRRATVLSHPIQ